MRDKTREEIVKEVEERVKTMIKSLLETLMKEERELYLEEHPTKANGYYTRDLLTLAGPVEDLRVPRVREGDFHPKILPYRRRTSLELSEAILALYACGLSTRTISRFLESVYGAFYSPQSISRLTQVVEEEVRAWRTRPLDEEYYAVFLDGTFLSIRRGKSAKEPVYLALGLKPDGRREILGFWLFGAEGESARNWEEVLKELRRRGVNRVRVFVTDDLPGLEEAIRKIFPDADWQLCVLHAVREALNGARKKDREALAQDLGCVYRAEREEEALGIGLPQAGRPVGDQSLRPFRVPPASSADQTISLRYSRARAPGEGSEAADEGGGAWERRRGKALYLVLSPPNERPRGRELLGFAEIHTGSYHEA